MTATETKKQIDAVVTTIAREYKPEKVILFGSWARGNATPDSDIDLFVIKETGKDPLDRAREVQGLIFGHGYPPVDVIVYTPQQVSNLLHEKDSFLETILREGTTAYEKK